MHIHVLGICGTFMGGLALLAEAAGHRVTGCDENVYPPMSTQLRSQGVDLTVGYEASQVGLAPDLFVVGNAITRGNPLLEEILDRGLPLTSGPQWLAENVLNGKWVLAVAGTHGKTTTASMLAWILEYAGLKPGFLIGGVPKNFDASARWSDSPFFVVEADEYDTAFSDKRSKFVHYRARTAILNNLEYDHADIFPDLAAIETQFHHFVRTLPRRGLVIANGADSNIVRVLERGVWTPVEWFGSEGGWSVAEPDETGHCALRLDGSWLGKARLPLAGVHNRLNALASVAAARHTGVSPEVSIQALEAFLGVRRRLELRGVVNGIAIYDDFAHHPTAIALTIRALRQREGSGRIIAVLEPRSNTMKRGVMKDRLPDSLAEADAVFCYAAGLGWDPAEVLLALGNKAKVHSEIQDIVDAVKALARRGDHVLVMSNGGFGGIHEKLLSALAP